jgi:uncharacterized protein with HEPN domain
MSKNSKIFFEHILENIGYIEQDVAGIKKETFFEDRRIQQLIIRSLEVIGEAITNIPEETRDNYPEIPWRDIMDMRNKLIHEYFGIDDEVVWKTVKENIPALKEQVEKILKDANG